MKAKSKVLVLSALCILSVPLTGCRGSAGKKAATEALEFIEKKGASTLEKEAAQAERRIVQEAEEEGSHIRRPPRNLYDEYESSSQVYPVQCSQCGGVGAVYVLDYYGNRQYDYYGNPVISQCPSCGGVGSVLVSE